MLKQITYYDLLCLRSHLRISVVIMLSVCDYDYIDSDSSHNPLIYTTTKLISLDEVGYMNTSMPLGFIPYYIIYI